MIDLINSFLSEKHVDLSIVDKLEKVWVPQSC